MPEDNLLAATTADATTAATTTTETAPAATDASTTATTADATTAATKDAASSTTQPAPVVPEKYEFKMPEGVELNAEQAAEFSGIAKELGLTQEQAQKVADLQVKAVQKQIDAHKSTVNGWRDTVINDKELGGDKLQASVATANKAIDLAPPELRAELRTLLDSTGMGNHPALFKWAHAIGKLVSEDGHVTAAAPPAEKKPFYNNSNMVR